MSCAALDLSRVWLSGGGLSEPWTYGRMLAIALAPEDRTGNESGVAAMLLRLTRAICRSETIDLDVETVTGEEALRSDNGVAPLSSALGPQPNPLEGSESELILRTSGSTGQPRVVRHAVAGLRRGLALQPRHHADVWGFAYNPTHIAGVQVYLQAFGNGNSLVNLWGVGPEEILKRCATHRVTHLSATPTFYRLLLPLGRPLPAVRSISVGGERSDPALLERLRIQFPGAKVRNIYASTEAGNLFTSEGEEFIVGREQADRVRCGQGRLWLHRSLLGDADSMGEWYDTGDLIEVIGEQPLSFRVLGRASGWINVGGEKVNPEEVEEVIGTHPGITLARVKGMRNSVTGQLVAADVVRRASGPSPEELTRFLAARLPAHKVPRIIRVVDAIELTRSGKLVRHD